MQTQFELQVISTGEVILSEETDKPMVSWQRDRERFIFRRKRWDRFRDAILTADTICAWTNYDAMVSMLPESEMDEIRAWVFKGGKLTYDFWFDSDNRTEHIAKLGNKS